jgi:hypothetical protein
MIEDNPIIQEIREARERLLAEFNGDLSALAKEMQRRTEEAARAGRKVVSMPPRRPEPSKKVG